MRLRGTRTPLSPSTETQHLIRAHGSVPHNKHNSHTNSKHSTHTNTHTERLHIRHFLFTFTVVLKEGEDLENLFRHRDNVLRMLIFQTRPTFVCEFPPPPLHYIMLFHVLVMPYQRTGHQYCKQHSRVALMVSM